MKTWIPLWDSVLDSTLWEEPGHVRLMFLTMLLLADVDHIVREPIRRLAKAANLSEDKATSYKLAEEAIRVLSSPDKLTMEHQEFDGRRIKRVDEGWLILNGSKYEEERKFLSARMRKTKLQRERRERNKQSNGSGPLAGEREFCAAIGDGDEELADRIVNERLPERKHGDNEQSRSGRTAKGPSGVSEESQSRLEEVSGAPLPDAAPEGPSETGSSGDNQPGVGDGGVQASQGEEKITMTLEELTAMTAARKFPEV